MLLSILAAIDARAASPVALNLAQPQLKTNLNQNQRRSRALPSPRRKTCRQPASSAGPGATDAAVLPTPIPIAQRTSQTKDALFQSSSTALPAPARWRLRQSAHQSQSQRLLPVHLRGRAIPTCLASRLATPGTDSASPFDLDPDGAEDERPATYSHSLCCVCCGASSASGVGGRTTVAIHALEEADHLSIHDPEPLTPILISVLYGLRAGWAARH
ncbi:hypothetical protein BJ912DRAFT_1148645 [Pholiota molesta]|nr:hypothetical protein BJ912DRAFT_1148645 [Pholiota molesta]